MFRLSLTQLITCVTLCLAISAPTQVTAQQATVMVKCNIVGKGAVLISVVPKWAPLGAARFLELVDNGFYDGTALFRAINNFLVQFGMSRNKKLQAEFGNKKINDDPMIGTKVGRGVLAFAGSGKNSRSSQIWIAYKESRGLGDEPWETPFGYVMSGMDVIDSLYTGYDDQVSQSSIWQEGYQYLVREFPKLDYISTCQRVENDDSPELGGFPGSGGHPGLLREGAAPDFRGHPGLGSRRPGIKRDRPISEEDLRLGGRPADPRLGGRPADPRLGERPADPRLGGRPADPRLGGRPGLGRDPRLGDPRFEKLEAAREAGFGRDGSLDDVKLRRAGMVNKAYARGANIASKAAGVAGIMKKGIAEETSSLSQSLGTSVFALVFGSLLVVMVLIIYKAMKLSRTDKSA